MQQDQAAEARAREEGVAAIVVSHDLSVVRLLADRTLVMRHGRIVESGLTDRQRTVLEAAYRSGYFEWPRRHTSGEELADALGVASSTLHQHLRVATAKVLDSYFDGHVPDVS